jgi:hypothetical protein
MASIDTAFSRTLLAQVVADVRAAVPGIRLRDAWVYHFDGDHWEFHFGDFYWHGSADDAYHARAEGWEHYLRKLGVAGYETEDL